MAAFVGLDDVAANASQKNDRRSCGKHITFVCARRMRSRRKIYMYIHEHV